MRIPDDREMPDALDEPDGFGERMLALRRINEALDQVASVDVPGLPEVLSEQAAGSLKALQEINQALDQVAPLDVPSELSGFGERMLALRRIDEALDQVASVDVPGLPEVLSEQAAGSLKALQEINQALDQVASVNARGPFPYFEVERDRGNDG